MRRYKEEQLQGLSKLFQQEYESVRNLINQGSSELTNQVTRLEELRRLRQTIEAFPEWPFYAANLGRIATTVFAPLAPAILTILTKFTF